MYFKKNSSNNKNSQKQINIAALKNKDTKNIYKNTSNYYEKLFFENKKQNLSIRSLHFDKYNGENIINFSNSIKSVDSQIKKIDKNIIIKNNKYIENDEYNQNGVIDNNTSNKKSNYETKLIMFDNHGEKLYVRNHNYNNYSSVNLSSSSSKCELKENTLNILVQNKNKNNYFNELEKKNKIYIDYDILTNKETKKNLIDKYKKVNLNNKVINDFIEDGDHSYINKEKNLNHQCIKKFKNLQYYNNLNEYFSLNKFGNMKLNKSNKFLSNDELYFKSTCPNFDNFFQLRQEFYSSINNFENSQKRLFSKKYFLSPLINDQTLICKVKIHTNKSNLGLLYPTYTLHISNSDRFLLAAKKIKITSSSLYYFSMDVNNFSEKSSMFLGKLNSNFFGNKFKIFDYKSMNSKVNKNFIDYGNKADYTQIEYV